MEEKILVIQTAFLGDAILTLPMIQKLKGKFSSSSLSVLCIPSTKELFEHSPFVDRTIIYDKRGIQKSLKSLIELVVLIRREKFKRVYSPHRSFRTSMIVLFSGVKFTVGFDRASWSFVYKTRTKYFDDRHEVERNLELLRSSNSKEEECGNKPRFSFENILPVVKIPEEAERKIQSIIKNIGAKKIIAVAPGSVWKTKIYPKEYFVEVIKYLLSQNYFVVLIGGNDDAILCDEIENRFPTFAKSFAGDFTIIESIALLKKCSLLISNDSAPTHLGMAADIPTLTIYCSTVPSFGFYPYNKKSKYVSFDDLSCKPCGIHGRSLCPIKTFDCAYKLSPEIVIAAVKEILSV
ncbi:MAG: glycosyltransferase family 9 protein [Bacteroidota bacterium]